MVARAGQESYVTRSMTIVVATVGGLKAPSDCLMMSVPPATLGRTQLMNLFPSGSNPGVIIGLAFATFKVLDSFKGLGEALADPSLRGLNVEGLAAAHWPWTTTCRSWRTSFYKGRF